MSEPGATVAILTYNAEVYLERILVALDEQQFDGEFEVLVIDSGSTDATLDILARFPHVRLHRIANVEFGHGRTRNLAVQLARGEYVAFLTHDAVPVDEHWLEELLVPFSLHADVQAVVGKQTPRPGAFPLQKYEILTAFQQLGPDYGITFVRPEALERVPAWWETASFYSDVNSAARRRFLLEVIPYRDVAYAEDQLFARDVLAAGHLKAYAPLAAVEHSNDLTWAEYGARIFDETVGLRRVGFGIPRLSLPETFGKIVWHSLRDAARIVRDRDLGARKLPWLVRNPFFQIRKWTSYRHATRVDLEDETTITRGSLESRRRAEDSAGRRANETPSIGED